MVLHGARKPRAKSVRSMLSYAHYRFQQFLRWKCWQTGKALLLVNEAYTSKTCSWSGEIIANLGCRKVIVGSDGIRVDREPTALAGYSCGLWEIPLSYTKWRKAASATSVVNIC